MASDDSTTIHSSMHEDEDEDHDQHHPHNMSRLSICTSISKQSMNDFYDGCASGGDMMMMFMSSLSIESSYGEEGEADGEFPENDDHKEGHMYGASSDSDKEIGSFLSLPGTPLQIQQQDRSDTDKQYYCCENESGGKSTTRNKSKRSSRRRIMKEKWLDSEWEKKKCIAKAMDEDSEGSFTSRAYGRQKSMCIDLGEVKACRDHGFELENPTGSCSTIDATSSGGNSPITSWRISSPGDNPKDVKARLKVWAHAVAASASRLVG